MVVEIHCFMYKIHNVDFRGWAGKPFLAGKMKGNFLMVKVFFSEQQAGG